MVMIQFLVIKFSKEPPPKNPFFAERLILGASALHPEVDTRMIHCKNSSCFAVPFPFFFFFVIHDLIETVWEEHHLWTAWEGFGCHGRKG